MNLTEKQKEDFNKACCIAMESVKTVNFTPFLSNAKSGTGFAKAVNHYLLHDKNAKFTLAASEFKALTRVYIKYSKLCFVNPLRKSQKKEEKNEKDLCSF